MPIRFTVSLVFVAIALLLMGGCQNSPPTVVYIVVTPTPDAASTAEAETTAEATDPLEVAGASTPTEDQTLASNLLATSAAETLQATQTVAQATIIFQQTQNAGAIAATQASAATVMAMATANADATVQAQIQAESTLNAQTSLTPRATNTPTVTPLPSGFPTPVVAEIQVAEQLFERGRMFWLQPTDEIWVLVIDGEGRGTWSVYPDTYMDGEVLSEVIAPADGLITPERGFGKLWREAQSVRDALGFAVTPEFGYVSPYVYNAGGSMAGARYTPGPGYHIIYSLYGEQFRFNEVDGTWQLGGG